MKLAITLVSLLALTSSALADDKAKADQAFKEGQELMAKQKYAAACEAFERSNKLDPGIGAQANVGKCYHEWGKLGRAYTAYKLALKMAKDAKDRRVDKIEGIIAELEPEVPRLTIKMPKDAPKDLVVTLDNETITTFGTAIVVDPGPHTLVYGVADQKKQKIVPMDKGAENEVTLEITKGMMDASTAKGGGGDGGKDGGGDGGDGGDGGGTAGTKPSKPDKPTPPGRNMRIAGIALGGAGVLAIGISSVMTLSARGKYKDALADHCGGMTNGCDPEGLTATHDARSTANVATVVFFVGLAAVGGGVALYLLAPKGPAATSENNDEEQTARIPSRYLVPSVTDSGGGLVYGGSF